MDRKLWLLALCVAGLMFIAFGQKAEIRPESSSGHRYQLIEAQQEQDGKMAFVLDTQSGRVWKYQPSANVGKDRAIPSAFVSVGFGIPDERFPGLGLKASASEDTRH